MRFGNCVDLAQIVREGSKIIQQMMTARFDFLEANLTTLAQATEAEFAAIKRLIAGVPMDVPVCNCMFPGAIRIVGEERNAEQIHEYLDKAFARAAELGVTKVILGSDKSRQQEEGRDQQTAYREFIDVLGECVVPVCSKYAITVLIEPLRKPCNFINTLEDGMRVVRGVDSPRVKLMADTLHVMTSGETPKYIHEIQHVHVSDWNRALPEFGYSSELTAVLRGIHSGGYAGDFSFETRGANDDESLLRALLLLKQKLGAQ